MRVLNFCVDEQKISKMPGCDFSNIARGSSDYLKVHLSVSDGWSGCAKVAEFYDMLGQLRESAPVINNACTVPAVVTGGILWGIRIVGAKGNYRITTNRLEVMQS